MNRMKRIVRIDRLARGAAEEQREREERKALLLSPLAPSPDLGETAVGMQPRPVDRLTPVGWLV